MTLRGGFGGVLRCCAVARAPTLEDPRLPKPERKERRRCRASSWGAEAEPGSGEGLTLTWAATK